MHSLNHYCRNFSLLSPRGTQFLEVLDCCVPSFPGKEIKLLFLFPPKFCLCISIRHQRIETEIWKHYNAVNSTPTRPTLICVLPLLICFPFFSILYKKKHIIKAHGASLVAQWLRTRLPMQGTRVRALVWEDPTCRGATKPGHHNY